MCKALQAWLAATYRGRVFALGPDGPAAPPGLHLQADHARALPGRCARQQADFCDELAVLEAHVEQGEAVLYYADAAHPTHNTRCTRAWCASGPRAPLLTVSGRERVNLNAALNAYAPTQVLPR
ncbi:MAG: hypothetical protein WKG07_35035 [Hymenobacter sp.]